MLRNQYPNTYQTLKNIHGFTAYVMIGNLQDNQCDTCAELDGNIYLLKKESEKIPAQLHPNCRCTLIPVDLAISLGDNKNIDIGEFSDDTEVPWYQKLLNDFVDKNEGFITKFSKGNIVGGSLNLLGATLNSPKNLYLNALNAATSLLKGEKPSIIYNMDFHDYSDEQKRKFGGKSISDITDSLGKYGFAGGVTGGLIDIASEILTDPLFIASVFKSAGTSMAKKSPENAIEYAERTPAYYHVEGKLPKASELKNSSTVQSHMDEYVKYGKYKGEPARPYIDSSGTNTLIDEIMQGGTPVKDSYLNNGLRWDVSGIFRGSDGIWELVVDLDSNTIVHFNFKAR